MIRLAAPALLAASAMVAATPAAVPDAATAILPSGAEFRLEIAADPESHARGYMYREHVGPREGMLFIFERDARRPFWMKNCRVALDIVWLDERLRVVHIAHDVPPCPEQGDCPPIRPMRLARYVLEFAGGTARAQGLGLGDEVLILSEPPLF